MKERSLICADVESEELERRYLAGLLSAEDAEAFEQHYFACERCWASLQLAVEVRAAFDEAQHASAAQPGDSAAPVPLARGVSDASSAPPVLGRVKRWWPAAMAAAAALVITTSWLAFEKREANTRAPIIGPVIAPGDDAMRGGSAVLPLVSTAAGGELTVAWPRIRGADSYRVRLFGTDGALLLDREIHDTSLAVSLTSLGHATIHSPVFWDVRARDGLNRVISRSALTASPASAAQ